ncbi:MAG: AAA family ATPase [Synergistaceae bacterium]|jgi:exonuclease SbcC|nr:AAA family ATPase [Synergistaceae bacterium]
MRILNVRFKNLNSLFGEWKIDFTNPAYASDGIFAITGPTGAGKTTILDAICLALYGRTPRLKDVTQSTNEVMSRHTGECFSEIVFETGTGARGELKKYCAFWGQHRARKKSDGALQQPRHEIADAETGTILETRQRDTAEKIKEVTGLTFDQFVRSILLAQGSFSAFLQSEPGERSPILEQITGTEIYSQISVRVHEIRNAERTALSALEAEASGLRILEPEEKKELETKLTAQLQEEAEAEKNLERYNAELDWLETMAALQKELDALEDRNRDLTRRQEGFESERQRLERAQQALEFGSVHAALITLRKEQEAEKRTLFDCQAKLPELEADVRRSEESLQLATSLHMERQADQKNVLDLLRKIRELDFKEKEKEAPIREVQTAAEELAKTAEALRVKLDQALSQFETAQIRARDVRKFLQDNAADERLVEQLTGIRTRFDALRALIEKRQRSDKERVIAEKRRQEAQNRLSGQSVLYETAKAKFTSEENALRKQKGVLDELLGTRAIAEWRESLAELVERKIRQGQIEEILERRVETMEARKTLKTRLAALESSRKECQQKIAEQRGKIQNTEKEVQHLEVQIELLRRIKDLEEARSRLRDGEPCPLCGSTAHPYASGNMPQADEVQLDMRRAKDELGKDNEALSALQIKNAQIDQETFQIGEEEARLSSHLQILEGQLTEELAALQSILPMDADPLAAIGRQRQKTEEILQKTRLTVERAEKLEKEQNLAREELGRAREERDQLARSQQEAEFVKETATREWDRLTQEIRLQDEELKNIRLDLAHQVAPFGFKNLPDERPEQVLESLEKRSQKWQEQHRARLELEKQLSVWERDVHHMRADLDKLNLELKDRVETTKKLRAEKNALRQQRVSLFGEKDPDAEEAAQAALVESAQKQVEAKRGEREIVLQEFSNMHSRMEELGKSIHVRSDSLQKAEISFKKQLIAGDFRNEDAYLAACLPEAERRTLQERAQSLSVERAELDARQMDRKFGLEELRRRHLTDSSLEETRERKAQTAALVKELQQSIGALRSRLKNEEDFALKRQEQMIAIEKQKREYHRWEKLHDLIGSADGQKYRNFAQSLTFEMVIRHANQQLQKMMDRYFLICDNERTLELKVVDNYQAGEVRSSKNLSGGESFIVSLALALGLSQMASQKVRVDSLFLDEGFGTLDEEALDMALSTLTSLRQEGKVIGVISHVEALKERIGTQIEVIPQGNGRSVIRAPGCAGTLENGSDTSAVGKSIL